MIFSVPRNAVVNLAWTTSSFGWSQATRLLNNVILARLLAPPLFGLMVIVNTIRTGVELLSDVGIAQNIISHRSGATRDFLDTAWTLQMLRGVALGAVCFLSAGALARLFDHPELTRVLPVAALFFIFSGFDSAGRSLLQKQMSVPRLSLFEVCVSTLSLIVHVVLALITPTIWALILGSVITAGIVLVASFMLVPSLRHRVMLDRATVREVLHFGRWIFLSSLIYFAAMNFDRLYFARQIPLAALGIYGIARTLSDTVTSLVSRAGGMVLFPMVAASQMEPMQLRRRLLRARRFVLLFGAAGLALFVSLSDRIVALLYDARYQAAGTYLPILLLGVWFGLLCTINESILTGMRRPAPQAIANLFKFATFLVGVPIAFAFGGLPAAILVLSGGEGVRYATLWAMGRKAHVAFGRDDAALTLIFLVLILLIRGLLHLAGVTGGIDLIFPWLAYLR